MWWRTIKLRVVGAVFRSRPVMLTLMVATGMLFPRTTRGDVETSPAPPRSWEFIIIHHSATRTGSAEVFDGAHRARGMINGMAYHFVIDNGTDGKPDGCVETGSRWVKQMPGGHCRQACMNEQGIGICLVGDFSHDPPTAKQLDALVSLVRKLQEQFNISDDRVLGHGDVAGENSKCPGHAFPWEEFRKRMNDKSTANERK